MNIADHIKANEILGVGRFTQSGEGAVARTAQDKLRDTVHAKDFGVIADGVVDDTAAVKRALQNIAARSVLGTYRTTMPQLVLPAGKIRITEVGALSAAFSGSPVFGGIVFSGHGPDATTLVYDNEDAGPANHALDGGTLRRVVFENMSIQIDHATSRFINWTWSGAGSASHLEFRNVAIEGVYERFIDIGGTVLGSETRWFNVSHTVPTGGTFFYVDANLQSVNHEFHGCTISCGAGGTVFRFGAGGNLRWFGGYSSLADGATFLEIDAPGSGLVGIANWDFSFYGWRPEVMGGGNTGACRIVEANRGYITFTDCNLALLTNSTEFVNFLVETAQQNEPKLVFRGGTIADAVRISVNDGTRLLFDGVHMPPWTTVVAAYERRESDNRRSPLIAVRNCHNNLDADPFQTQRDAGETFDIPPMQSVSLVRKVAVFRAGTTGNANGLSTGLGGTYASNSPEFNVPLGSVIVRVKLVYIGRNSATSGDRTFKVTNHDGSVDFIAETTISALAPSVTDSGEMWHLAHTSDDTKIVQSGKTAAGTPGTSMDDYGCVIVEYY